MPALTSVSVAPLAPDRFREVLASELYAEFGKAISKAEKILAGRTIWNVNSTARGGGVAEMLASLLAYARGAGVDARWIVVGGNPDFFAITKRIHNRLHGAQGSSGDLGAREKEVYERTLHPAGEELADCVRSDDVVILHDPQTAGLIAHTKSTGARVIWRCHVGLDTANDHARSAWDFLRPYVSKADAYVFSRKAFAWEQLDTAKLKIIRPSIDAFSPKNQDMDAATVRAILHATGALQGDDGDAEPTFIRGDGRPARVERPTDMLGAGPVPVARDLVVQVSRWDRLKDPVGVIEGFGAHVSPRCDAHLLLAGPSVEAVADDPEGAEVLEEAKTAWQALPEGVAERVHLACLPMDDGEENAAIVNALQRRADVVVQKSIAEGFGLTVAEGMWKGRAVVASRIGGIQDQIEHGVSGVLVDDPHDLAAMGDAVTSLLLDPGDRAEMGKKARLRVRDEFLGPRHLMEYLELIEELA